MPKRESFGCGGFFAGLEVGDAIEGVVHAFDGVARGVVGVDARHAVAREPGSRAGRTSLREPLGRGEDRAAVGLATECRFRPEPDQEDPLGRSAPDADDRECLRALAREVAALQDARDGPAARPVDPPRRLRQDPVLVDAYDRAGGALARGPGLDCMKLHDPRSPACRADRRRPVERAGALVYRVPPSLIENVPETAQNWPCLPPSTAMSCAKSRPPWPASPSCCSRSSSATSSRASSGSLRTAAFRTTSCSR